MTIFEQALSPVLNMPVLSFCFNQGKAVSNRKPIDFRVKNFGLKENAMNHSD
jgi:hypothetical protein